MNSNFPPKLKWLFLKCQPSDHDLTNSNSFQIKSKLYKRPKNKKLALKLGIQSYQILSYDDEVCIPSLSSIILAVPKALLRYTVLAFDHKPVITDFTLRNLSCHDQTLCHSMKPSLISIIILTKFQKELFYYSKENDNELLVMY